MVVKRPRGAIIIGGSYRALGVVRSLGRHGIPAWVLAARERLAGFSRYVARRLPWPQGGMDELPDCLLRAGEQYALDGWALIPTADDTAAVISRQREILSARFQVTVPAWETLCAAYDKRLTHRLAAEVGLPYPWTIYPRDYKEVETLYCPFPVILKPAVKKGSSAFVRAKAWLVRDRGELLSRYQEACTMVDRDVIMIQELIPGGGEAQFSYAALCFEGNPRVSLVARRTRQYPPDFGHSSSFVETVEQPEVETAARRLVAALSYTGVIQIQFKRDARNGQFKLLDINPRFWGSHTLSRRFGGDFPYLLWQMLQNAPIQETRVPPGIRWVHAINDLPAAAIEMRRGSLAPRDYFASFRRPLECAVLAADDPLPALVEMPLWILSRIKRVFA